MHSTELHSTAYPPPEGDVKKGVDEANSPKSSYPFFGIHVKGKPRLEKFQNTFMTRYFDPAHCFFFSIQRII